MQLLQTRYKINLNFPFQLLEIDKNKMQYVQENGIFQINLNFKKHSLTFLSFVPR
jgi:hypothetical protein